jgi:hypothetical protein
MMTLILIGTHIVCIIGGVIAGALIWRNNAKKFSQLEQEARAKGLGVAAWIKEKTGIDLE